MRRLLLLALLTPVLILPAWAQQDDQKADLRNKILASPFLIGRLTKVNADDKAYSLQVMNYVPVQDAELAKQYNSLSQQYNTAARLRNQEDMKALAGQIKELQTKLYQEVRVDFLLKGSDDLKVRFLNPPIQLGSDGNPVAPTPEDLQKMKGADNLVGYTAAVKDLATDQWVRVYLDRTGTATTNGDGAPVYPAAMFVILPPPVYAQPDDKPPNLPALPTSIDPVPMTQAPIVNMDPTAPPVPGIGVPQVPQVPGLGLPPVPANGEQPQNPAKAKGEKKKKKKKK